MGIGPIRVSSRISFLLSLARNNATTATTQQHESMSSNPAHHDEIVARLEVRKEAGGEGTEEWSDAGPIDLDSVTADILVNAGATPVGSAGSRHVADTPPVPPTKRKRRLPRRTKLLLSPNAKIKGDRKANFLFHHSADGVDSNLLILLHGAGDSHRPFCEFAKRMDLPQTASLSIHASSCNNGFTTLPFNLGNTWFEEMDYAVTGNALDSRDPRRIASLSSAIDKLVKILESLYPQDGDDPSEGWMPERIFLFGYSAGASLVMETCLRLMKQKERGLGGAVCVAGGIECEIPSEEQGEAAANSKVNNNSFEGPTPILAIVRSNDINFPPGAALRASTLYSNSSTAKMRPTIETMPAAVTIFVKDGKGPAMVSSEDEMRSIMEFMAKRLVREMPASAMGATGPLYM